jgi:hypothetical protein
MRKVVHGPKKEGKHEGEGRREGADPEAVVPKKAGRQENTASARILPVVPSFLRFAGRLVLPSPFRPKIPRISKDAE